MKKVKMFIEFSWKIYVVYTCSIIIQVNIPISVKSPNDVQTKEVVVGVVTDMDLLHYVTQNETAKLQSISENSGASTNSGQSTPEPIE